MSSTEPKGSSYATLKPISVLPPFSQIHSSWTSSPPKYLPKGPQCHLLPAWYARGIRSLLSRWHVSLWLIVNGLSVSISLVLAERYTWRSTTQLGFAGDSALVWIGWKYNWSAFPSPSQGVLESYAMALWWFIGSNSFLSYEVLQYNSFQASACFCTVWLKNWFLFYIFLSFGGIK